MANRRHAARRAGLFPVSFVVENAESFRFVTVHGEIDLVNASDFRTACFERRFGRPTIVDLRFCSFMDTAGLAVLTDLQVADEVALIITPESRCYRIFEVTNALAYFTIGSTFDHVRTRLLDKVRVPS